MPVIGFIIGYLTNYIAIKMLFHPRSRVLGIQGVIPRRKSVLAKQIGEVTPEIMPPYLKKVENIPHLGPLIVQAFKSAVEKQINSLDDSELEKIVFRVVKKEMRFVVWVGGILGFLIGCIQVLVLLV